MAEPKIILTMMLPGSVMMTQKDCEKSNNFNISKIKVEWKQKGKKCSDLLVIKTRVSKPAKQVVKMPKEAYDEMLKTVVKGYSPKDWRQMPIKARLNAHMGMLASFYGATSYSFEILGE